MTVGSLLASFAAGTSSVRLNVVTGHSFIFGERTKLTRNTSLANLVLQSTIERIFTTSSTRRLYADIPRGVFLVRGENVLLLGEIDLDKDDIIPEGYEIGSVEEVHRLAKEERRVRDRKDKKRVAKLREEGFEGENVGEILL